MPTEELEFWTDDPLLRQIRDELMPKQMGIDPLRNPRGAGVLFDNLAQAPCRVGLAAVGFKKVGCPSLLLALQVLGLCRKLAFLRQNLETVFRKINDLCVSTFLFSVICDRAPPG